MDKVEMHYNFYDTLMVKPIAEYREAWLLRQM